MFNIAIGMIWQVALVVVPMYAVTWKLGRAAVTMAVVVVTSVILKFTWYDHLRELEHINVYGETKSELPEAKLVSSLPR